MPRIFYLTAIPLALYLAFTIGRTTAPWEDPLYIPTESRADCLEVRLVPDDQGDGLMVRAWLWDGDGHVVWTRDLYEDEPLGALWDETPEGQYAVDAHHAAAEHEVRPAPMQPEGGSDGPLRCSPNIHYMTETRAGTSTDCY